MILLQKLTLPVFYRQEETGKHLCSVTGSEEKEGCRLRVAFSSPCLTSFAAYDSYKFWGSRSHSCSYLGLAYRLEVHVIHLRNKHLTRKLC